MWTRTGTVLTVSSRAMVEACARLGVDTRALLEAARIPRATLEDPDARLEASQVSALWTRAYQVTGDPVLSLHAAEACPYGAYKVVDYIATNAASVGEAFRLGARYFKLINTAIRLPIDESGDPITFDVEDDSGPHGVTRPYAEYCLATFVLHIREASGVPFPLERVTFVHAAPPDLREHERLFGCPVEFGAARNRIEFRREVWETPSRRTHAGVLAVLIEHADLLLERLPNGPELVDRTRRAIAARLRGEDSSLEAVARELCLSPRTLQRRLRDLGHSYNDLADEVRAATAQLYLAQPDFAIAEVAHLLGFAEPSTFHRAYKRWTGETPAATRARLGGAPPNRTRSAPAAR